MVINQEDVRLFLVDYPESNDLLDKEEFSSKRIEAAIAFTVDRFNDESPQTLYLPDNFPFRYILLVGTVIHLLKSEIAFASRNRLPYQDGQFAIDDKAKVDSYRAIISQLEPDFKKSIEDKKVELNANAGWSSISSPFSSYVIDHRRF